MTTVYIAAEKLIHWTEDGKLFAQKDLIRSLKSASFEHRLVAYFIPSRFGLIFDDPTEVQEAWHYCERLLTRSRLHVDDVLFCLDDDLNSVQRDRHDHPNTQAILISDDPSDVSLAQTLGVRMVSDSARLIPSLWHRIFRPSALRQMIAAAINP